MVINELSHEFIRDVIRDKIKAGILPAKWMLRCLLIWPDNTNKYITATNLFVFLNLALAELCNILFVINNFDNVKVFTSGCMTVATNLEALLRVYVLVSNKEVLNGVLHKIWKNFWSSDLLDAADKRVAERRMRGPVLIAFSFLFFAISSNSFITGVPYVERSLILKAVFPFDWSKMYIYEFIYLYQYLLDWFVLFMVSAFDFLFIGVTMICALQFVVLQDVAKNINGTKFSKHREIICKDNDEASDFDMLLKCVNQHRMLMKICKDLDGCFYLIIVIQLIANTLALCISSFLVVLKEGQVINYMAYNLAHLVQLFNYCYAGNELYYESTNLSQALFEINWHTKYDKKLRNAIIFMIQMAQRGEYLSVAGVTVLDISVFFKVLKIAFSVYNILNALL